MKTATKLCLLIIGLTLAAPGFAGKDPLKNAIKARQGEMQLRAFNVGPLFGMAKGKIDYDADLAKKLAGNLKLMLDLDNGRAWAKGSDIEKYMDETTALPKIWTTYPVQSRAGSWSAAPPWQSLTTWGQAIQALRCGARSPAPGDR